MEPVNAYDFSSKLLPGSMIVWTITLEKIEGEIFGNVRIIISPSKFSEVVFCLKDFTNIVMLHLAAVGY